MSSSPGTVSKILWHFTGGPEWDAKMNRQGKVPKLKRQAYDALVSILKDRELKIGNYKEVIKLKLPVIPGHDEEAGSWSQEIGPSRHLISAPVCCLADIPIVHLGYHAERYGKFAIGFHRASAIRHGFNPVFYQFSNSSVLLSIYAAITHLGDANDDIAVLHDKEGEDSGEKRITNARESIHELTTSIKGSLEKFRKFLAFVKTFDETEFGTIYCEREWRSIEPLNFEYDDISMIALPRSKGDGDYFERFVEEAKSILVPPTVSIVAWDDLVEH